MTTKTHEIYIDDFNTIQDAVDFISHVGSSNLFGDIRITVPPVQTDDNVAGPGDNIAYHNETVDLNKSTVIFQGQGISTFISYDGGDHTLKLTKSDAWVRDMWVDNEDSTGNYDAINIAATTGDEFFLDNVEIDGAGRHGINVGTGTARGRMIGCTLQSSSSKSADPMTGLNIENGAESSIISSNIFNGLNGGAIVDNGSSKYNYMGLILLNGATNPNFDISGGSHTGASILATQQNDEFGMRLACDDSSFAALNAVDNTDDGGVDITGNENAVQGAFSDNGGNGVEISGLLNNVSAVAINNAGDGINTNTNGSNLITAATNRNSGSGASFSSNSETALLNCFDNNGAAEIRTASGTSEHTIFGRARSGGNSDTLQFLSAQSLFCGLTSNGSGARILGSQNTVVGKFIDGIKDDNGFNVIVGHVETKLKLDDTSKAYTQYGEHMRVSSYSGNATLGLNEDRVTVDTSSGDVTITLPSATGDFARGKEYRIKNTGTGGNNLIVESTNFADGEVAVFVGDGSSWIDFS